LDPRTEREAGRVSSCTYQSDGENDVLEAGKWLAERGFIVGLQDQIGCYFGGRGNNVMTETGIEKNKSLGNEMLVAALPFMWVACAYIGYITFLYEVPPNSGFASIYETVQSNFSKFVVCLFGCVITFMTFVFRPNVNKEALMIIPSAVVAGIPIFLVAIFTSSAFFILVTVFLKSVPLGRSVYRWLTRESLQTESRE